MIETEVIRVDPERPDPEVMRRAGELIRAGELVAFPTETVYGLGGDALNPESSKKIYAAKGRPSDNPLIVHIADRKDLARIAAQSSLIAGFTLKTAMSICLSYIEPRFGQAETGLNGLCFSVSMLLFSSASEISVGRQALCLLAQLRRDDGQLAALRQDVSVFKADPFQFGSCIPHVFPSSQPK